jgi:hypothetical protein
MGAGALKVSRCVWRVRRRVSGERVGSERMSLRVLAAPLSKERLSRISAAARW